MLTELFDLVLDYFKFIVIFFVGIIIFALILIPSSDWDIIPNNISIVSWLQNNSLTIAYGMIIASSLFILWKYKTS